MRQLPLKQAVFVLCTIPFVWLIGRGFTGDLGANPIEAITHDTGIWTLRLLLVTLAVTPLRYLSGWAQVMPLRQMVGLFAFFYGCLHFATYIVLDWFFDFEMIIDDVVNRPYITAGFAGFLLLVPLAITSTRAMTRRLGGRRWRLLHRLVYVSAAAGALHFIWQAKADPQRPAIYAGWLVVLLGVRVWRRFAELHRGEGLKAEG